jgi:hypothetical protein
LIYNIKGDAGLVGNLNFDANADAYKTPSGMLNLAVVEEFKKAQETICYLCGGFGHEG